MKENFRRKDDISRSISISKRIGSLIKLITFHDIRKDNIIKKCRNPYRGSFSYRHFYQEQFYWFEYKFCEYLSFCHWMDDVLIFCVLASSSDVAAFVLCYYIFIISDVLYGHVNDKFFDQVVKSYLCLWYLVINWSNKFIVKITRRLDDFWIKLWWRTYSFNINDQVSSLFFWFCCYPRKQHKKCQEMNFDIISKKICSYQYFNIVTIFKIFENPKLFAIFCK